jgi:photosystem II stability/assembly factor-like uncharacterized protein
MKIKLSKILGVGLSLMLLVSMMVMASPAQVSAGTLSCSDDDDVPKTDTKVLMPNLGYSIVDIAVNGDTIYAATNNGTHSELYKSTDGGNSWSALSGSTSYPGGVVERVAVAPDDPDIVCALFATNEVEYSDDGGASWSDMNADTACADVYDIDVSAGTTYYVAVAGNNTAGTGDLFVLKLDVAQSWRDCATYPGFEQTHTAVRAVKFSPNFATDKIINVVSGNTTGASVQVFRYESAGYAWNGNIPFYSSLDWGGNTTASAGIALPDAITGGLAAAAIDMDPEYLGTEAQSRLAFVATAGAGSGGGVVRLSDAYVKQFKTWSEADEGPISSIAYHSSGKLLAGDYDEPQVFVDLDPMASSPKFERLNTLKQPGGYDETTVTEAVTVAWAGDTAVCGTQGDECAFAVSTSDGMSWDDVSLINTRLTVVNDLAPNADASVFYMTTRDGTDVSLWKKASAWKRVFAIDTEQTATADFLVRVAPDDDNVVYLASKGTTNMYVNKEGGMGQWKHIPAYRLSQVQDFAVESADVVYAIDGSDCSKTKNAGTSWGSEKGLQLNGNGFMVTVAPNGDVLVGSTDGYVSFSKDGGATFTKIIDRIANANTYVVADDGYADNNIIYGAADDEIERNKAVEDGSWAGREDAGFDDDGYWATGIGQYEGVVYIVAENGSDSKLWRALNLEKAADSPTAQWSVLNASGEQYNYTPQAMKVSKGPLLWFVDTVDAELESCKDSIGATGPSVIGPAEGASIKVNPESGRAYPITFTFERPASKVYMMEIQIGPDESFSSWIFQSAAIDTSLQDGASIVVGPNAQNAAEFMPGTTYYWRVRATQTDKGDNWLSPWSATRSFIIEQPVSFALVSPVRGGTNVSVTPTLTWNEYAAAKDYGYEVMISEDKTFAILDQAHTTTDPFLYISEPLAYGTTYYWRVRGQIGPATQEGRATVPPPTGPWVTGVFQTMPKPAEEKPDEPTVITIEKPAPPPEIIRVEVPGQTQVVQQAIPDYLLWIIIAVGAILVICLIVLIVRTRRVS